MSEANVRRKKAGVLGICLALCWAFAAEAQAVPNVVVILVDDMGYSDLGCYGSEIPTPNLDGLAASGVRFTSFYNTGRCCPTRAALLTGLYPHQAGVGHMMEDKGVPGYRGRLNDSAATIAEVLKGAGYFTAMTGKWHVGQHAGVAPWTRGFDRSLNSAVGGFYFAEHPRAELFLNGEHLRKEDPRIPAKWYSTDLWTDYGLRFIDEALAAGKPFYLHLCHNAPHFSLQAPAEDIARFRGKYRAGFDAVRAERFRRQKELGIVGAGCELAPRPDQVKAWESCSEEEKDRFDHIMAVYAAVVYRMDRAVGDLVAGLKKRGVLDDTLILFMSDNGGNAEAGPEGRTVGDPSEGRSDWFSGMSWAYVQNTPYRLFKHYNHEGGIGTPLIAHWPRGIAARNELRAQPAHLVDIMATCVEVSGAAYPKTIRGETVPPMEGKSLVGAFANQPIDREALYWEHEGNAAVRAGDLKLVRNGQKGKWELYDLGRDRSELRDLSADRPSDVSRLSALWDAWAVRTHVLPAPEPGKPGKKAGKK
jgi:arylsulfatase A-like enzyme